MIEWALIAALGWLTYDQAGDIGTLEQSNKQLTATITSNNKALDQCYADIKDNEKNEVRHVETIGAIKEESRRKLLELEKLRNSNDNLRAFDKCRLPDEIWHTLNPVTEYGL